MQGMFNDTKQTDDLMEAFKIDIGEKATIMHGIELTVSVLTTGTWPLSLTSQKILLPSHLTDACKVFEDFYLKRHSGRKLTWQFNMGTVDLKAHYLKKRYTLNMPTYMMAILMLFNDATMLTVRQIGETTQIPPNELNRLLMTLAHGKNKLLSRNSVNNCKPSAEKSKEGKESKELDENDEFTVNGKFSSSHSKIKVTIGKATSGEQNPEKTRTLFLEDRKNEIDAAVVRIMKSRGCWHHTLLVNETISILSNRFKPDPRDIKKRIENLIERGFLERANDNKTYTYKP